MFAQHSNRCVCLRMLACGCSEISKGISFHAERISFQAVAFRCRVEYRVKAPPTPAWNHFGLLVEPMRGNDLRPISGGADGCGTILTACVNAGGRVSPFAPRTVASRID